MLGPLFEEIDEVPPPSLPPPRLVYVEKTRRQRPSADGSVSAASLAQRALPSPARPALRPPSADFLQKRRDIPHSGVPGGGGGRRRAMSFSLETSRQGQHHPGLMAVHAPRPPPAIPPPSKAYMDAFLAARRSDGPGPPEAPRRAISFQPRRSAPLHAEDNERAHGTIANVERLGGLRAELRQRHGPIVQRI
jgi:hypothetical protein